MEKKQNVPALRFQGFSGEWGRKTLGEIFNFKYGTFNNNPSNGGKYPVYGAGGIQGGYTDYNAENSIIIGHMGDAGCVTWGEGKHFVTYNGTITTAKNNDLPIKYGYYLLSKMNLQKLCGGSSLLFLTYEMIQGMKAYVSISAMERKKVALFLSNIDKEIDLGLRRIKNLQQFRKAMLAKIFPREGAAEPELRFRGFSGKWKRQKLAEIVDVQNGYDYKSLGRGTIPVYGTGGYMLSVDKALSYDKDAIGIGRKGTIDKPFILKAPFWTVDTLFYAIPREINDINFVLCLFQKIDWKSKNESTGVPSLSKTTIEGVKVVIPSAMEQKAIGDFFYQLDRYISLQQKKLERMQRLKAALLEKLFV